MAPTGPPCPPTAYPSRDDQLLRRLAASLAHHVNNALTGVIGFLELGLPRCPAETELESHLRASLACAYQAADAVKRIVAFAFRTTEFEPPGPLSLREVAGRVAEGLRGRLPAAVTVEVAGDGPGIVWVSEALARTVVEHLAHNALEAMPHGGTLLFHVAEGPRRHRLSVRDTGDGMAPEVLAHLFEPFLTTKTTGHLGLGLVLCREMVEAQGGAIQITSDPGRGTEVTLSFPPLPAE